ncbi:MAG TPA: hypothetical protein VN837_18090, partial [Chloroflexota bacterium]|nr:hypothetical protein [Chloroflexota bacterium]
MQAENIPAELPLVAAPSGEGWRQSTGYLLGRKALGAIFVIYIVVTLSFFLIRLMPGNAVDYLREKLLMQGNLTLNDVNTQIRAIYGLDIKQPLGVQYLQ